MELAALVLDWMSHILLLLDESWGDFPVGGL